MSVEVLNESGQPVDLDRVAAVARHVMTRMGVSPLVELSVALHDEVEMERLHVQYMDEPGPTDVMAFEQDDLDLRGSLGVPHGTAPDDGPPLQLGDVAVCPQVAARQAEQAGHAVEDEIDLLVTHGVLHLLKYDHVEPDEHKQMFDLQGELLASWREVRAAGR